MRCDTGVTGVSLPIELDEPAGSRRVMSTVMRGVGV